MSAGPAPDTVGGMKCNPRIAVLLLVSLAACGTSDGGGGATTADSATAGGVDTASAADVDSAAEDSASVADTGAENAEDTGAENTEDTGTENTEDTGADASSLDAAASDATSGDGSAAAADATPPADAAKKDCKCGENQWSCLCGEKGCGNGAYGGSPGKHLCVKNEGEMWEYFMPNTDTGWWCDKETNCK